MAHVISRPIDALIHPRAAPHDPTPVQGGVLRATDVLIVGSGYGASVAAARLAGLRKPNGDAVSVLVLERGSEHAVGEFPNTLGELPGHVRYRRRSDIRPIGTPDALFEVRSGEDLDILVACGLGGGSLINANVAARPDRAVFDGRWPAKYRDGGLDDAYDALEKLLGVGTELAKDCTKFRAFQRLAEEIPGDARAANLAVTTGPHGGKTPNAVGIAQPNCTRCGNCVTGCNVGAKNTLMMNLIPLAHARDAEFVTGANVLRVLPSPAGGGMRWRAEIQRTHSVTTPLEGERFYVDARYLVLAAGTLGSTEILLRSGSAAAGGESLALPVEQLGERFSTNGDGLGFSFGQRAPVHAVGTEELHGDKGPGPTITGILQGRITTDTDAMLPFTLEDGTVPAAIVKLFGEALITGAQLHRLGDNRLPGWFEARKCDPLAYNRELLEHGQMLLMMGDDRARRSLALHDPGNVPDIDMQSVFPSKAGVPDEGLERLEDRLVAQNLADGLDAGQYVANPLRRLLPRGAQDYLGGKLPSPRHLSVHPLGGCPMGASSDRGVVNEDGIVFAADGGLHDGLYVMDGSILPRALATNPFLTIGAVAWKCCDALLEGPFAREGWTIVEARRSVLEDAPLGLLPETAVAVAPRAEPLLVLREQMIGKLLGPAQAEIESIVPDGGRLFGRDGLVLHVKTEPVDVHERFSSMQEGRIVIRASIELFLNSEPVDLSHRRQRYGVHPAFLKPLAQGTASITLLELDEPDGWLERTSRTLSALRAFADRRYGVPVLGELAAFLPSLRKAAAMHTRYRQFDYACELGGDAGLRIEFFGRKELRWTKDARRPWHALLSLPVAELRLSKDGQVVRAPVEFRLDAAHLLGEGLIQVQYADDSGRIQYDMVESAIATVGLLAFFGRCLLEAAFWDFAAPTYPKLPLGGSPAPPALGPGAWPARDPLLVCEKVPKPNQTKPDKLPLELHRYAQPGGGAKPLLLIHGLAQGSGIFTSPHIGENMARYFWKKGYDVWVLDYRLSNRFTGQAMRYGAWALDVIGNQDVPKAVERVFEETGQRVRIFAHCVGAIGVQMAILAGRMERDGESWIESVCFNAIHPWIVPAPANLARAKLGAFARGWVTEEILNPILECEPSAARTLFDRIASSLARLGEDSDVTGLHEDPSETDAGHGPPRRTSRGICDRMTLLYGRMWKHQNLARAVHDHWHELVGPAPTRVYQQLYYLMEHGRLLDDEGRNTYLTLKNLNDHWRRIPTLFLHGDDSEVFNPDSATLSASRLDHILRRLERESEGAETLAPVWEKRLSGYGHMDPILAEDAHLRSFPVIEHFFDVAARWHASQPLAVDSEALTAPRAIDDVDWPVRTEPETGHALRAAWIDEDTGTIVLRHWLERYRHNTEPTAGVTVRTSQGDVDYDENALFGVDAAKWCTWLDEPTDPERYAPRTVCGRVARKGGEPILMLVEPSVDSIDDVFPDEKKRALAQPEAATVEVPHHYRRLEEKMRGREGAKDQFAFLVGSCRYPGIPTESELSDAVFEGMSNHIRHTELDMAFFIGDQIYADAYNDVFDNAAWRDRYDQSYRAAFGSRHMREVLRSLPIHFAMDDHEIADNWSGSYHHELTPRGARGSDLRTYGRVNADQLKYAKDAACRYMSSARAVRGLGGPTRTWAGPMWYSLDHRREVNFPCFVLDTRSERELRGIEAHDGVELPRMLDDAQLGALRAWLTEVNAGDMQDRPKFIFAGQILAPMPAALHAHPSLFRQCDGFVGYPRTLDEVIGFIVDNKIRNVVFVGGDQHISCAAELTLRCGERSVKAWQLVASGLFSPLPFGSARPRDFCWEKPQNLPVLARRDVGFEYSAHRLTESRSHFVQVRVEKAPAGAAEPWIVSVSAFDSRGRRIAPVAPFDAAADETRMCFE